MEIVHPVYGMFSGQDNLAVLRRALLCQSVYPMMGAWEVGRSAQEERVRVATWEEFGDGILPDVWSPFCPLKWMAQYLREHNPQLFHAQPLMPKAFHQLTREEKLEMLFHHLDRDNNGALLPPLPSSSPPPAHHKQC